MKEEKRKSKKKVLLYYLILAACLLVIAAVTVTVIFTVKGTNPSDITIDNPGDNTDDDQTPDEGDDSGDNNPDENPDENPDAPTGSDATYGMPLNTTSVTVGYEFAYDKTLDLYRVHQGMDFECSAGDNVYSVLDGTVTQIVKDSLIGENYVVVTHANGITSTYKYMIANDNLYLGQAVKRGDALGKVAEAAGMEMDQGEHLHFVITVNGKSADPDTYLNIIGK